jgi:hypothetical protein
MRFSKKLVAGAVALGSSAAAMADTSSVDTSSITAAGATVALVGGAVFAVYVGVKTFKWIRAAL